MLSGSHTNVSEDFPKFSENFRRFPKIAEEDPKMFRLNIDKPWPIEHCNMANSGKKMISHMCGYHFYPHMCDTIFLDLLPLAIPLQFI